MLLTFSVKQIKRNVLPLLMLFPAVNDIPLESRVYLNEGIKLVFSSPNRKGTLFT